MSQTVERTFDKFTKTTHHDTYDFINPLKSDLTGKTVFVSGASRGIGKETALSYARAGASGIAIGARSSLTSLQVELKEAAKNAGRPIPKVVSVQLDVTDVKSVDAAIQKIKQELGGLDILVNNAGYLEVWRPIHESDPQDWWKTWEINIKGVYLVTRAALPLLLDTNGLKTIVNVSSIGAHYTFPGASSYQTGKLALLRFTEFTMAEYGEKGILAFSIHPGGVLTELAQNLPKQLLHQLTDTPNLSADATVWLTKERREWLAGRYIAVDWDMEELEKLQKEIVAKDLLKVRLVVQ
ncbi:putative oxidoreductase [Panus rudis PR-1116 ss-1]|nr:putative oxidoreductase [Panus rudis PR-1116 ss-1]